MSYLISLTFGGVGPADGRVKDKGAESAEHTSPHSASVLQALARTVYEPGGNVARSIKMVQGFAVVHDAGMGVGVSGTKCVASMLAGSPVI